MTTRAERDAAVSATCTLKKQILIEEVEHLISCGVSEYGILETFGYTRKPEALKRRLTRSGRRDLIPKIFEWEAGVYDRKMNQ